MKSKKLLLLTSLGAGLFLWGCAKPSPRQAPGPPAEPSPRAGAKFELTLFTWTREDELAVNQELARAFEQSHPGISVRILNVPGSAEAMAKLHTMTAGGQPPDVASLHGAFYYSFADSGALADLDSFIAQDKSFDLSDFNPRIVEMCRWKGKLYSLPRYTSIYALFYNKDLFDAAGVPYPSQQKDWTWDAYLKTARALTRPAGPGRAAQWGCYLDFWGSRIYPWLWQNGADLMDAARSKVTLDTPEAAGAIRFLVELRHKYKVAPEPTPGERNEGLDLFCQGRVAMYMSGPWDVREISRRAAFRWDVWHLPRKRTAATMLGTENYVIMAGTKHPKEAWELFKFLLSPSSQELMAARQEKMPSRLSVLKGAYLTQKVAYNRKVFVDALDYSRPPPNIPEWDKVAHYIQEQLDLIWAGQVPVEEGLRNATSKVNELLANMRTGKA